MSNKKREKGRIRHRTIGELILKTKHGSETIGKLVHTTETPLIAMYLTTGQRIILGTEDETRSFPHFHDTILKATGVDIPYPGDNEWSTLSQGLIDLAIETQKREEGEV